MIVIGLTGKMYSGKSTVAGLFKECAQTSFGYGSTNILPFAGPLKSIARSMGWNGVKDEKGRRLLQLLGTECGRLCVGEDCWINLWRQSISAIEDVTPLPQRGNIVIIADDCRYDNEAKAILSFPNGHVINVRSDAAICAARAQSKGELVTVSNHASESGISAELESDWLDNHGDLDVLAREVGDIWDAILDLARNR